MGKVTVRILPNGDIQFIDTPDLADLKSAGVTTTRRASHVEPARWYWRALFRTLRRIFGESGAVSTFTRSWPVLWRVNLTPSGGPILSYEYRSRSQAIEDEVVWLLEHRMGNQNP